MTYYYVSKAQKLTHSLQISMSTEQNNQLAIRADFKNCEGEQENNEHIIHS